MLTDGLIFDLGSLAATGMITRAFLFNLLLIVIPLVTAAMSREAVLAWHLTQYDPDGFGWGGHQ